MTLNKSLVTAAVLITLSSISLRINAAWITTYEGYNVFENPCPSCDGTVTFAVWQRDGASWLNDTPFASLTPGYTGRGDNAPSTGTEQYVFLYQVTNTDPQTVTVPPGSPSDGDLQEFNVLGDWIAGGFFSGQSFAGRSSAVATVDPEDAPSPTPVTNNLGTVTPLVAETGGLDPNQLVLQVGDVATPEANLASGLLAEWTWDFGNFIPTGPNNNGTPGFSSLLFLTAAYAPTWGMGETEGGGTGAAGNLPTTIPAPGSLVLLIAGLAGLGMALRKAKSGSLPGSLKHHG